MTWHHTPPSIPPLPGKQLAFSWIEHAVTEHHGMNMERIPWCFRPAWLSLPMSSHWHRQLWVPTAVRDSVLRLCSRRALQVLIKTWHYAGELKGCFYTQILESSLYTSCKPLSLRLLPSMLASSIYAGYPSPSWPHFCCSVLRV